MSFLCKYAGATVLQVSLSIFGILGGPLLGVISLGMFVPIANGTVIKNLYFLNRDLEKRILIIIRLFKGALCGLVLSVVVNMWLGVSSALYGRRPTSKPFTQHLCPSNETINNLASMLNQTIISSTPQQESSGFR